MTKESGDLIVTEDENAPEEMGGNAVEVSNESTEGSLDAPLPEATDNQVDSSHHYDELLITPEAVGSFKENLRADGISEEFIEELAKIRIENDERKAGINIDVNAETQALEQNIEADPNIAAVQSNELTFTDAESGDTVMTATDTEPAQESLDNHDADLTIQKGLEEEAEEFASKDNVVPFPGAVFRTRDQIAREQEVQAESLTQESEVVVETEPVPADGSSAEVDSEMSIDPNNLGEGPEDEWFNRSDDADNTKLNTADNTEQESSLENNPSRPESNEHEYETVNDFYENLNEQQKQVNANKYLMHIDKEDAAMVTEETISRLVGEEAVPEESTEATEELIAESEKENIQPESIPAIISEENIDAAMQQGKQVELNGKKWNVIDKDSKGRMIINRDRTPSEALELVDSAIKKGGSVLPSSYEEHGAVDPKAIYGQARWMAEKAPRSNENSDRIKELASLQEVRERLASGEFNDNKNYYDLLTKTLDNETKRLDEEKRAYEKLDNNTAPERDAGEPPLESVSKESAQSERQEEGMVFEFEKNLPEQSLISFNSEKLSKWSTEDVRTEHLLYLDAIHLIPEEERDAFAKQMHESVNSDAMKNSLKYAGALKELYSDFPDEQLNSAANHIYQNARTSLHKLGIEETPFTQSHSWVSWDMAKQYQLYKEQQETGEVPEGSEGYQLDAPQNKTKEIADRHIGWEVYAKARNQGEAFPLLEEINGSPDKEQILALLNKEPKPDSMTLSSKELAELGGLLSSLPSATRELANEEKESLQKKLGSLDDSEVFGSYKPFKHEEQESEPSTSEVEPEGEYENAVKKLDNLSNTEVFNEFGITPEDLAKVEGFNDLSPGQRLLVAENLKQMTLARIYAESSDQFTQQKGNAGFLKKMGLGMIKKYKIAKLQKANAVSLKEGGIDMHSDVLQKLVEGAKDGPGVEVLPDGSTQIEYIPKFENLSDEEKAAAENFNKVANEFSKIPDEWSREDATKEQQEQFNLALLNYNAAKENLVAQKLEETEGNEEKTMDALLTVDQQVQMNRFMTTHPDVEKQLQKVEDQRAWTKIFTSTLGERGMYMVGGYAGRAGATAMLSAGGTIGMALAAPLTAGVISGMRSRFRAKDSLVERDELARRGKTDESAEAKNFIEADKLSTNLDRVRRQIEEAPDEETRQKHIDSLVTRIKYTEDKIKDGLVSYGDGAEKISNQYELMKAVSFAGVAESEATNAEPDAEKNARLDRFLNFKDEQIDDARKSYIRKETIKGAAIGVGFAAAGSLIRVAHENNWWDNSDLGKAVNPYISDAAEKVKGVVGDVKEAISTGPSSYEDVVESLGVEEGAVASEAAAAASVEQQPSTFQEMLASAKAAVGENAETPISTEAIEHEVQAGDNLWNVLKDELRNRQYTDSMTKVEETHLLDAVKDRFASMSNEDLQSMGFSHIGADGRIDINMLEIGDKLDLSKVLTDTEFMTESLKDTVTLSEEVTESIAKNLDGSEEFSDTAGESVATMADMPTEAIASDQVTENITPSETLEKNGIEIEPENEVMSQEQAEAVLPVGERVPQEFNSARIENHYNAKYGPEVAQKMKGNLGFLFGNNPELYEEWKGNAMWPGMKDQSASDLFNEQHRAYYLKSTRVDGSPSSLTYTNESGEQVTDMMVEAKRNQLFVILDQIKAKGISPTEGETVEDFMARGYKEIAEIDATPNAVAEATATIESVAGGKIPPQAETPNYTGEQAPETLTAQNVIVPEEPNIKIVNYENLEDLDAKPATLEQLGDQNYLRTQKLSSADYEQLSKVYKNEYRVIEKDLKEIFDSERYEREGLNKAEKLAKARDKKLLDELRDDVRDIKKSNRSKSGLSRFGGELKENLAENRYENARDVSRARIKENFDHGFRHEWSEAKQPIKNMRVEDITDDSFTKLFQRGVNSIEGRNRRQFSEYINDLIQEVPNQPDENIQDYLYRVAGVRGSVSK